MSAELERAMRKRNVLFKKEGETSKFRSAQNIVSYIPAFYGKQNTIISGNQSKGLQEILEIRKSNKKQAVLHSIFKM